MRSAEVEIDPWLDFPVTPEEAEHIKAAVEALAVDDRFCASIHVGYALDDHRLVHIPDRALRGRLLVLAKNPHYGAFWVYDTPDLPTVVLVSQHFPDGLLEDGVRFLLPVDRDRQASYRDVYDYIAMFNHMRPLSSEDRLLITPNVYGSMTLETGEPSFERELYAAYLLRECDNPYYELNTGPSLVDCERTYTEVRLTVDGILDRPAIGGYFEMLHYAQLLTHECELLADHGWRVVVASAQRTRKLPAVPIGW